MFTFTFTLNLLSHHRLRSYVLGAAGALVWALNAPTPWAQTSSNPSPASSASQAVNSRITQIKLYPGSATVERTATLRAGVHRLQFDCLPAQLQVQSLQVQADEGVRVGAISTMKQSSVLSTLGSGQSCANTAQDVKVRELEERVAALNAEKQSLRLVTDYLGSASTTPTSSNPVTTSQMMTPAQMMAMADALRQTGLQSFKREAQITRELEDIALVLTPLKAEQQRVQQTRKNVMSVVVELASTKDAQVRLSYQITGPSWQPAYRAMLNTRDNTVQLERQALVSQNTGEDWSQVKMVLSTTTPNQTLDAPTPRAWYIGIRPPVEEMSRERRAYAPAAAAAPMAKSMADSVQLSEAEPLPDFSVQTQDQRYEAVFRPSQTVTVHSGSQRLALSLGMSNPIPTSLKVQTEPYAHAKAWLVAQLPIQSGVWPAGKVQLYRDDTWVGDSVLNMHAFSAHKHLPLPFGQDEKVIVTALPEKHNRANTGVIQSRIQREHERTYTVENRHPKAVELEVLESTPQAQHKDIDIKTQFTPAPTQTKWNEQPGVILWEKTLNAGESARFTAQYTISYPAESALDERR